MRNTRGPNTGDRVPDHANATASEELSGLYPPATQAETSGPLTPREEAELNSIFGQYDDFVSSISRRKREPFDPCRAVLPLREALKTANLLVDCMRQSSMPDDSVERAGLREHVLDCEERAADLIGRLARLRRSLKKGRAASASG